ncbi:amino acid transporter [Legionella taurinensis]|uniref:Amino acid transporter n=1 Tax=Legionella taurinensis TaxID=70611 RepID=A0A3A5L4H0_9GAMM|nr:LysE/ArgO family amino acid transporter [Legionella taurinensis]MDX1836135.1 LysE/ArgO family amino acid transporter [Legionella taurinensis]PUT42093.1 lysine transporter LysE [Legionella taurinensis]PUT44880.1 lysine transporter LysE [Legionella taurinensis]PUT48201.1 lysine transporter LysE [Legionella taurinensis]PUT49015.1 lysine transporter LysE [Legionella taurinensis]
MLVYFNGLVLGLSLIMALGPQNVFLIRQGAQRRHAVLSALVCFCCDLILVCGSVAGLYHVLELHPQLKVGMTWFGVAFLMYYGSQALKNAFQSPSATSELPEKQGSNRLQIILLALGFSLLNPHAIIDSLVIIGTNSAQFPEHQKAFILGVATSSLLWFSSLTFTTHYFSDVLSRTAVWRRVELCSGLLMICLSLKLAASQF